MSPPGLQIHTTTSRASYALSGLPLRLTFIVAGSDAELEHGERYSVLRHSRPFVIYQGVKTNVAISVFGDQSLPSDRRVFLQRRGYRTALL